MNLNCIDRLQVDAEELDRVFPPRWRHPNKSAAWEKMQAGGPARGTLNYSRWAEIDVWPEHGGDPEVRALPGVFEYGTSQPGWMSWHLNFADPEVFGYYSGSLLAQDEMQVLEHPSLGSLKEYLDHRFEVNGKPAARTEDDDGASTPVLVAGAPRRCRIAVEPNASEGRPQGLYGNRFQDASSEVVQRAITALKPPTISNILAISAPAGGYGRYSRDEICAVLRTCVTGMLAVRHETRAIGGDAMKAELWTGWWGCGAFGGNRRLMAMAQLAAAAWSGLGRLTFAAFDEAGVRDFVEAHQEWGKLAGLSPEEAIDRLYAHGFEWGESDGN